MDPWSQRPTLDALPETPLRLRGGRVMLRLSLIGALGAVVCVLVLVFVRDYLNLPPLPNPTGVFLTLLAMFCAPWVVLYLLTVPDLELSRAGIRNVGLFGLRKRRLIRWSDFEEQRVAAGRSLTSYRLLTADPFSAKVDLAIGDVGNRQHEWIQRLIRCLWKQPAPPEPPEVLFTDISGPGDIDKVLLSERRITVITRGSETPADAGEIDRINHELQASQVLLRAAQADPVTGVPGTTSHDLREIPTDTLRERQDLLSRFLAFEQRCEGETHSWGDIEQVDLWMLEHGRHDFTRILLQLPNRTIEWRLRRAGKNREPNFRGADPVDLRTVIQRHVPPQRIALLAENGCPQTMDEWDRRYDELVVKEWAAYRKVSRAIPVVLALLALVCLMGPWPQVVAHSIIYGPMFWAIRRFKRNALRERDNDYARWRTELDEKSGCPHLSTIPAVTHCRYAPEHDVTLLA